MRLQQNQYLWVQFVGLAAVPLLLDICLVGLASSGLAVPFGIQFWAIALLGIAPTLWMQLVRPFYVFSLPPVALNPTVLSDDQRRCLRLLKSWQVKALAGLTAIFSLWVLSQLYAESSQITPLMTPRAGLISAAVTFLLSCAFLQISVSTARALLVGAEALKRVAPYEVDNITADFLILGLRVKRILPEPVEAKVDLPEDNPPPLADSAPEDEILDRALDDESPVTEDLVTEGLVNESLERETLADQGLDGDQTDKDFDDEAQNDEISEDEDSQSDSTAD